MWAGLNTYGYVGGNPLTRFDPFGLWIDGYVWPKVGRELDNMEQGIQDPNVWAEASKPFLAAAAAHPVGRGAGMGYQGAKWCAGKAANALRGPSIAANTALNNATSATSNFLLNQSIRVHASVSATATTAGTAAYTSGVGVYTNSHAWGPPAVDFASGLLPGPPPPTPFGYAGGLTGEALDALDSFADSLDDCNKCN